MRAKTLVIVTLMGVILISIRASASDNLIVNPGFEEGQDGMPVGWLAVGDVTWVTDEVHSGNRAVRVHASEGTARVKSNFFEVAPHSRVEISAWMKASDIVGSGDHRKLRYTVHAHAADLATRLAHWDLVATEGSFDWKQVIGAVIAPPGTKYMVVEAQLDQSSGTFWIDDVEARVVQTVPEVDLSAVQPPVILPQPWRVNAATDQMALGTVVVHIPANDQRLYAAIAKYFQEINLPYRLFDSCSPPSGAETLLLVGDSSRAEIDRRFQELFPDLVWQDLGEQGYFISVDTGQPTIYLAGNTEQGRFYALQTLKQMIDPFRKNVYRADIADRPTLSRRGIIMGVQFYSQLEEAIERMAGLKLNFIWNQGSFLGQKFLFHWREPLTERERESLKSYLELARAHFIEPFIAIGPRGEDASSPTYYSSEEEINLVVQKMEDLYSLGFRNFGLAFDDLGNLGQDQLFGPDIDFFNNDIGEAHAYFVEQVYQRLKDNHMDISMMVVPMNYSGIGNMGDTDEAYLASLNQLPLEIGLYSTIEYPSDAQAALRLTGRHHMVWDNFWAKFYREPAPTYVIPLDRPSEFDKLLIPGYSFLPLLPVMEDPSLVTWRSAADYAWAPDRYDPEVVFQLAAAQYQNDLMDAFWLYLPIVGRTILDSSVR